MKTDLSRIADALEQIAGDLHKLANPPHIVEPKMTPEERALDEADFAEDMKIRMMYAGPATSRMKN